MSFFVLLVIVVIFWLHIRVELLLAVLIPVFFTL